MSRSEAVPYSVEELVPQAPPFVLIDRVVEAGEDFMTSEVRIAEDSAFFRPFDGVPSWIGTEYMAQTIAAFVGLRERRQGRAPQIGFLVAVHDFLAAVPSFAAGSLLKVRVSESFHDERMAVFDARITDGRGRLLLQARLNVFLPGAGHPALAHSAPSAPSSSSSPS
jgi:predicted hotdog family 3-hydroxylacyl-ACP dehydratase